MGIGIEQVSKGLNGTDEVGNAVNSGQRGADERAGTSVGGAGEVAEQRAFSEE